MVLTNRFDLTVKLIFPVKSVLSVELFKIVNYQETFYSLVQLGVLLNIRSTARYTIHLQFDISANSLDIRAV
jgi:hypothetical protein